MSRLFHLVSSPSAYVCARASLSLSRSPCFSSDSKMINHSSSISDASCCSRQPRARRMGRSNNSSRIFWTVCVKVYRQSLCRFIALAMNILIRKDACMYIYSLFPSCIYWFQIPFIPIYFLFVSETKQQTHFSSQCLVTISLNQRWRSSHNSSPRHSVSQRRRCPFGAGTLSVLLRLPFADTNNDGLVNWTDFEAAIEVGRRDRRIHGCASVFSVVVHRLQGWGGEKCSSEDLTQTSRATLSEIFLGFMRYRWC